MEDYKDLGFEEETNQEPSKLESLGRGIQQGATLGFSDELSGGIQAALDKLAPFVGLPSVTESNKALLDQGFTGDIGPTDSLYTQARNEERQILREAEKANPKLFGTGELVGSAIIPLGAASTGAKLSTKVAKGALAEKVAEGATLSDIENNVYNANKKQVEFAKRTNLQIDKNHINGITTRGKIIMTPHGFLNDDEKQLKNYKDAHSKEWSAILGGGDFTVVEEAYEDVTPNYFQEEPE